MDQSIIKLLKVKETDLRIDTIHQCKTSIDKGIHIGGAYSCLLPLTALFYGGFMKLNISDPTDPNQDLFILSKGHSVAAMASIYADLGYFDKSMLDNSRSFESNLNAHPGPLLPGVPVSTGPLGHGLSISCGFATYRKLHECGDIYCMVGDGELHEGSNWEGILYAPDKKLDNFCVLVDRNNGQSDCLNELVVSLGDLAGKFKSFGWNVYNVDGTSMENVCDVIGKFKNEPRGGKPTVIICNTSKGFGGFASVTKNHKATITDEIVDEELRFQKTRREERIMKLLGMNVTKDMLDFAERLNYQLITENDRLTDIKSIEPVIKVKRAVKRNKTISYNPAMLPVLEMGKEYMCDKVVKSTISAFAHDARIFSIDSDLANTSGLQEGVSAVDETRALNAGIAEAHMMNMSEALAAEGCNIWNSTFTVFFDCRAFRRIAVSYQERMENIHSGGNLNEGHGLDITYLATAPNLETQTNGATHMGNDDELIYGEIGYLKIIDVSCPKQLVSVMRWIAEGNKGLVYLRVPRFKIQALYSDNYKFEYGIAYPLCDNKEAVYVVISSGRGVHEALKAEAELAKNGIGIEVIDMPSIDEKYFCWVAQSDKQIIFLEQNNGYLYQAFLGILAHRKIEIPVKKLAAFNCRKEDGSLQFIHSGTYKEISKALKLDASNLIAYITDSYNDTIGKM